MKTRNILLILSLLLLLSLTLLLAACNGDQGGTDAGTQGGAQDGGTQDGGTQDGGDGYVEPAEHDFTYVANASGSAYLISSVKSGVTEALIPKTYLGKSIIGIDGDALAANKLTAFKLEEDPNQNFKVVDGILYSKNGKTLLAYPGGKSETSITIDKAVTAIGDYAFKGNTVITSLKLNKTTTIGKEAFKDCSLLASIDAKTTLTNRCGADAFLGTAFYENEANWSNGYLKLETYTFQYTKRYVILAVDNSLISGKLTFDNTIYSIADGVFKGNTAITAVEASVELYFIGAYAFSDCSSLESFTFSEPSAMSIKTQGIGEGAFMGCSSLAAFHIGNNVQTIEEYTFKDCTSLKYIVVANGTKGTPDSAFSNTGLEEVFYEIPPDGVASVDAVNGTCTALTSLPTDKRHLYTESYKAFENHHYWCFVGGIPTIHN